MDPLSISVSILTIIGAGKPVVKAIQRLARLKDAPASLLQLNNAISDLSLAVKAVEEFHRDRGQSSSTSLAHELVTSALMEARVAALELETLISQKLTKVDNKKIDRISWVLAEPTIEKMKKKLHSAKKKLIAATSLLNWYEIRFYST